MSTAKVEIPLRESLHPYAYFAEEEATWHGYIEWEKRPENQTRAAEILSKYRFADVGRMSRKNL